MVETKFPVIGQYCAVIQRVEDWARFFRGVRARKKKYVCLSVYQRYVGRYAATSAL